MNHAVHRCWVDPLVGVQRGGGMKMFGWERGDAQILGSMMAASSPLSPSVTLSSSDLCALPCPAGPQDYMKESDNLLSLHSQIKDCDAVLTHMEQLLGGFQVGRSDYWE